VTTTIFCLVIAVICYAWGAVKGAEQAERRFAQERQILMNGHREQLQTAREHAAMAERNTLEAERRIREMQRAIDEVAVPHDEEYNDQQRLQLVCAELIGSRQELRRFYNDDLFAGLFMTANANEAKAVPEGLKRRFEQLRGMEKPPRSRMEVLMEET
jgi:hypothetical protein